MNNISFIDKKCCGCRSCEQCCPVNAITFAENEEGFFYPQVDKEKCISCGLCVKKCPVAEPQKSEFAQRGYAAYLQNREVLRKSSSGGMFYAMAQHILENGGAVFGCAETTPGDVKHIMVDCIEDLKLLQGSKYVESDLQGVYSLVKEQLQTGRTVLFSGTPCQVAGARKFIGNNEKLICADIICHGVPSRKMYNSYLEWFEKKNGGKVKEYYFRSKEKNDWSLTYRAVVEKNDKQKAYEAIASIDPYYNHFLKGYAYRESCYQCAYAKPQRASDITIGDFWGIEQVAPDFVNIDGVSAVLVNSVAGEKLWAGISDKVVSMPVEAEQIIKNNGQLQKPTQRPDVRENIYKEFNSNGFDFIADKYKDKKEVLIDSVRDLIPNKTRQRIKKTIKKLLGK